MENAMSTLTALRHVPTIRPRLTLRGVVGFLVAADRKHRMRVRLVELDDRMLRDIGVTRADVADELRRPLVTL